MKSKTLRRVTYYLSGILLILSLLFGAAGCSSPSASSSPLQPKQRLRLATTTSLYDTGLWGYLEPMFEQKYGVELDIMYTGTGKALEYGRRGDVDIITVHSKTREDQFVSDGYGVKRVPFAYNYFLIVGPEDDPAGLEGLTPEEAFGKLIDTDQGSFISRGDDSGTHSKEKAIWQEIGYDYETVRNAGPWYIEAGIGMGPTLMMASEKQGYTLTDMGTYLTFKFRTDLEVVVDERVLELVPIVIEGEILLNVYSAIIVNPEKASPAKMEMANHLVDFLTSPEIQQLIGDYGTEDYGMQLFIPHAGADPEQD
ncbi:MAG: substrate-binding domain-containing protein [Dehalococcoidales bacterium]|nr:substrate-binding domain-containing protein [Dehalococcoidales bacterium]